MNWDRIFGSCRVWGWKSLPDDQHNLADQNELTIPTLARVLARAERREGLPIQSPWYTCLSLSDDCGDKEPNHDKAKTDGGPAAWKDRPSCVGPWSRVHVSFWRLWA